MRLTVSSGRPSRACRQGRVGRAATVTALVGENLRLLACYPLPEPRIRPANDALRSQTMTGSF